MTGEAFLTEEFPITFECFAGVPILKCTAGSVVEEQVLQLTPLVLRSHFMDEPVTSQVVRHQNGTAVLKELRIYSYDGGVYEYLL